MESTLVKPFTKSKIGTEKGDVRSDMEACVPLEGAISGQKLLTPGLYGGFEAGWPSALDGLDPLLKNARDHLTVFGRYFRRSIDQSAHGCLRPVAFSRTMPPGYVDKTTF